MTPAPLADRLARQDNNFNAIRLVAALAVVTSHAFPLATGDSATEPLSRLTYFTLGQHAVNVFFMLSGLVVAASLDRSPSFLAFAERRILRVFPALFVCALAVLLLLGPAVSTLPIASYLTDPGIRTYILKMAALSTTGVTLPGAFASNPLPALVNEPLWTIKYELLCYAGLVGVGALGLLRTRARCGGMLVVSLAVYAVLRWLDQFDGQIGLASHVGRFWLCFALGVTAYAFREVVRPSWGIAAALAVAFCLSIGSPVELVFSYLAAGYAILCLSLVPIGRLRHLTNETDLSYGIYIYGWPLTQTVVWAYPGLPPWTVLAVAVPLTVAAAWLSWHLIERPALSLRVRAYQWSRILGRREAVTNGPATLEIAGLANRDVIVGLADVLPSKPDPGPCT